VITTPPDRRSLRLPMASAIGAVVVVVAIAGLLPRLTLASDDTTIAAFLREDVAVPFIAPVLSQVLGAAYAAAPGLPWFGLWLYAVYALAIGLLAAALLEPPAAAPPAWRRAIAVATLLVLAGVAALVFRVTFTTAAVAACGGGLVAFAHEAWRGSRMRTAPAIAAGLALAAGVATRPQALFAAVAAVTPLLVATGWHLVRTRQPVPGRALAALVVPTLILVALGPWMPQTRDPASQRFFAFNEASGAMYQQVAFIDLAHRAPEVLRAAGWNNQRYWRFTTRLYFDDTWYTTARMRRLLATGGHPRPVLDDVPARLDETREAAGYAGALLAAVALAAAALALAGAVRRGAAALAVAQVAWLAAVALALGRSLRFPERIALPMAVAAACAALVATQRGVVFGAWTRARWRRLAAWIALGAAVALVAVSAVRAHALIWTGDSGACGALEQRIAARAPSLVLSYKEPSCFPEPLRAEPRPYPSLTLSWPIFSPVFYRRIAAIGATRGRDLVPALAADANAYVLVQRGQLFKIARAFTQDLPGVQLREVDATGAAPNDLVLVRAVRP